MRFEIFLAPEAVEEVRVFYDVSGSSVEVLAIVPKPEAESWLARCGSPK
jgi:hypothetical protein